MSKCCSNKECKVNNPQSLDFFHKSKNGVLGRKSLYKICRKDPNSLDNLKKGAS